MTARPSLESLSWYEAGLTDGIELGRRQVEDQLAAEWAALREEVMPRIRRQIDYALLAERRGQPERAARQRATLAERGVTL